jgi:hypothetical protein
VRGGNTYPKTRSCPNGRQHTDIKMSCLGTVVCVLNSYLHFVLLLLLPFLLLYFQRLHTSDNDQITYLGFTFVLKRE